MSKRQLLPFIIGAAIGVAIYMMVWQRRGGS